MLKSHLKEYRAKLNMNQSELAEKVGVTRQTIGFIEKGTISPSITLVLKICNVFQCKVEDLFELEDVANERTTV
ncbi:helix-turn-helix transcriptional regulator [Macrococcoides canis]|uniref:helix-turn-helix transcriptional regulator n=1 Tax=Macrococcoides canis TaxID=1855823 RepID=UPI00165E3015|nr:helix-turn-helix transcriptional regulator [Macrococcus canis]QNR07026.1 helix-turn-helix domain-containing protein [Macrococcus canis]